MLCEFLFLPPIDKRVINKPVRVPDLYLLEAS